VHCEGMYATCTLCVHTSYIHCVHNMYGRVHLMYGNGNANVHGAPRHKHARDVCWRARVRPDCKEVSEGMREC